MARSPRAILARRDFQRLDGLRVRIEFGDFGNAVYRAVSFGDFPLELLGSLAASRVAEQAINRLIQGGDRVGVGEIQAHGGTAVQEQLWQLAEQRGIGRVVAVETAAVESF